MPTLGPYRDQLQSMHQTVAAWMEETHYPGIGMYSQSRLGA